MSRCKDGGVSYYKGGVCRGIIESNQKHLSDWKHAPRGQWCELLMPENWHHIWTFIFNCLFVCLLVFFTG